MRFVSLALPLAVAMLAACGAPPGPAKPGTLDERSPIPAKPANGDEFVMPDETIPAGGDKQLCWVPDYHLTDDVLLARADGYQGGSGHHVLVFASIIPRQPGDVFDCSDASTMATMTMVMVPHTNRAAFGDILPDTMVVRVKKDQQIVIQSHYVNTHPQPLLVRDVVTFTYADPSTHPIEAAFYAANVSDLAIAPGQHTVTTTISSPVDLHVVSLFGHMHEWGRSYSLVNAADASTKIYDVPQWDASLRDQPPVTAYPQATPFEIHAGDQFTMTCAYNNDTSDQLTFPKEMCALSGVYFPALADPLVVFDNINETTN